MASLNLITVEIKAFLPARDFELSKQFYTAAGFTMAFSSEELAYFHHGHCGFLLQKFFVKELAENFVMHLLVESVDHWHEHIAAQSLSERFGVKIGDPADRPWGMRDFTFLDPSGVLWRVAQNKSYVRDTSHAIASGVECIIPILNVASVTKSLTFYTDVLGFKMDWADGAMASVSRDGRAIMLCEQGQGQAGMWIWIGVDDVEPLFDAFAAKGAKIRQRPTNYPWAYEMQIEDPDGHVLRFGSDPKADRPAT